VNKTGLISVSKNFSPRALEIIIAIITAKKTGKF
jgi:hypothetical protein